MYYQFKKRSFIRSHLGIVNRVRTNPEESTRISYCINYCVSHSVLSDSLRSHGLQPARLLCPWNSPGKNTGVSSHSLLQGIFLTQESNPGFLHCRQILYCLSHQVSPKLLWNHVQKSWILNIPDPQPPPWYVLSRFSCVQLCDSEDCSPSGSSVQGSLQVRILEWVAMLSFRGFSQSRD